MNGFIVRHRESGAFVDRWGSLHGELANAHLFPSAEEAEFYRLGRLLQPEHYEVCQLNADGQLNRPEAP